MRWSRALPLVAILALLAACGGGGGDGDGGDGGDGGGTTQTEPAEPTPDDGGGSNGGGGDGGGEDGPDDGSGGSFDLDSAFERLTPPGATELSKTTAEGVIFAAWDTDDDFDSLRSFYEDAIDDLGFGVITTTEAQGGIAWVVADEGGSGVGGSISIFPASDGSGTQVSVTIGEGA